MAVTLQWFFWGFSLVYSETGGSFFGDMRKSNGVAVSELFSLTAHCVLGYFGLKGVLEKPSVASTKIPAIVFCIYQLMFAAFTLVVLPPVPHPSYSQDIRAMIALGAVAERAHLGPLVVFVFVWSTLVYSPIARWTWNPKGWSAHLGVLDYAGGTPVHITSGATALALSVYLGIRPGIDLKGVNYLPNNVGYICLGTSLIWFGWFGFNGGSALGANFQAAEALIVTNIAACTEGFTFLLLVRVFHTMQGHILTTSTGLLALAGLVSYLLLHWGYRWACCHYPCCWLCGGS